MVAEPRESGAVRQFCEAWQVVQKEHRGSRRVVWTLGYMDRVLTYMCSHVYGAYMYVLDRISIIPHSHYVVQKKYCCLCAHAGEDPQGPLSNLHLRGCVVIHIYIYIYVYVY